jgi:hypothetical protein
MSNLKDNKEFNGILGCFFRKNFCPYIAHLVTLNPTNKTPHRKKSRLKICCGLKAEWAVLAE